MKVKAKSPYTLEVVGGTERQRAVIARINAGTYSKADIKAFFKMTEGMERRFVSTPDGARRKPDEIEDARLDIRLPSWLLKRVDRLAKSGKRTRSATVRDLIDEALDVRAQERARA